MMVWASPGTYLDGGHGASTLVATLDHPGSKYGLQISTRPFIVPGKLPEQRLVISVGEYIVDNTSSDLVSRRLNATFPPTCLFASHLKLNSIIQMRRGRAI